MSVCGTYSISLSEIRRKMFYEIRKIGGYDYAAYVGGFVDPIYFASRCKPIDSQHQLLTVLIADPSVPTINWDGLDVLWVG